MVGFDLSSFDSIPPSWFRRLLFAVVRHHLLSLPSSCHLFPNLSVSVLPLVTYPPLTSSVNLQNEAFAHIPRGRGGAREGVFSQLDGWELRPEPTHIPGEGRG